MSRAQGDRSIGRFLLSLATFVGIAVGAPLLLVAVAQQRFGSANPLAGATAPWDWTGEQVGDGLSEPLDEELVLDLLIRASLVVVWVAVAVIVVVTVAETLHLMRHRGIPQPSIRGLGWAQHIGRFVAVGLVVMIPFTGPQASIALDAPITGWVDGGGSDDVARADEGSATARSAAATVLGAPTEMPAETTSGGLREHVVTAGESVYSIASAIAHGDEQRTMDVADAIIDANLGAEMGGGQRFTNPAYIEVGWVLLVPGSNGSGPDVAAGDPAPGPAPVGSPAAETAAGTAEATHVVQPGDTLWDIADSRLGDAEAWTVIWERNAGRDMGDGRTFDDPHLILSGWTLDLGDGTRPPGDGTGAVIEPEVDEAAVEGSETGDEGDDEPEAGGSGVDEPEDRGPAATASEGSPAGPDDPVGAEPTGPDPGRADSGRPGPADPDTVESELEEAAPVEAGPPIPVVSVPVVSVPNVSSAPAHVTVPSNATATSATTTTVAPSGAGGGDGVSLGGEAPSAPRPIRLEHAALVAAGLLALIGVRRRQRLRAAQPRSRVPEPLEPHVATERRLRNIDAGERAARVDVGCRAIAHALVGTGARIGWVIASSDGDVRVRLTAAATLPSPWTSEGTEFGREWSLAAEVPIELLGDDARQVGDPCPALVQVGITDTGDDVLVDLEAAGVLAVDAGAGSTDGVVTAIATALASSLHAETAHLVAASLAPEATLGHRNAYRVESTDAAIELAAALTGTTTMQYRSAFELRSLGTGGEAWEPAIVLLTSDDDVVADGVADALPEPGHGMALVAPAASLPTTGRTAARLAVGASGWTLEAFGASLELTPLGATPGELAELVGVVDAASEPLLSLEELRWSDGGPAQPGHGGRDGGIGGIDAPDGGPEDGVGTTANQPAPFEPMAHEIVVGLLGPVTVTDRTGGTGSFERSKTVELIAWLATHRERPTRTGARTALWELDVRDATFANVVSEARRSLGRLVTPPEGDEWVGRTLSESLPLHDHVVTDAQLVRERVDHARLQPPTQALDTLRPAVEMVRDVPFSGTSYLWPDAEGITSNLVLLAITACTEFAAHALSLGDTDGVFWATGQGLRVLPGHEELIGLRMRAHARAGDLAGVRQEWEAYERVIVADAWSDGEPAPKLLDLRRALLSPSTTPD